MEDADSLEIKLSTAKMACGALLAWCSVYSLNQWVAIVTIAYILLQIGLLVPKYIRACIDGYIAVTKFFSKKDSGDAKK